MKQKKQNKETKMETKATVETKEVAVAQETKGLSVSNALQDLGIEAGDLIIPKLLLMQNTSQMVGDDAAKVGDIINSQSLEVLGGLGAPVDIIPLKMTKTWRVYDLGGKQPEFIRQEAVTAANVNLPWDDTEDGVPIRRDMCMNFFVLLVSDVVKEEAFPCVVSFKRTSMQAGKQLATHLFKMTALGKKPYAHSVQLKAAKQKTDTNTYGVFELGKSTPLPADVQAVAEKWCSLLTSMTYKVDDKDDAPQASTVAPIVVGGASTGMKF